MNTIDLHILLQQLQQIDFSTLRNTFIATMLLPTIVFAIKKEAIAFFEDLTTYRNREFDTAGDPGIGCECYLQVDGTGKYDKISVLDYRFHLFSSKRLVITMQNAPNGDGVIIVPYTYAQWRARIKGSPVKLKTEVMREFTI